MKIAMVRDSVSRDELLRAHREKRRARSTQTIIGYREVDENTFYAPLVEAIYHDMMRQASKV